MPQNGKTGTHGNSSSQCGILSASKQIGSPVSFGSGEREQTGDQCGGSDHPGIVSVHRLLYTRRREEHSRGKTLCDDVLGMRIQAVGDAAAEQDHLGREGRDQCPQRASHMKRPRSDQPRPGFARRTGEHLVEGRKPELPCRFVQRRSRRKRLETSRSTAITGRDRFGDQKMSQLRV